MQSHKIYNSVDTCPIGVFWKIQETGDLRWLIIQSKENILSGGEFPVLSKDLFTKLNKKYKEIDRNFPESAQNKNVINDNFNKVLTEFQILTATSTAQRARLQNQLKREKFFEKVQKENNENIKVNRSKEVASIETSLNIIIDIYECSIAKYYSYIELLNEKNKQYKATKNGR